MYSGAWRRFNVNYISASGFATTPQYKVGTPDNVTASYYLMAFIDTNGNGALDVDGSENPKEPVLFWDPSGSVQDPGSTTQLNVTSDLTSKNITF